MSNNKPASGAGCGFEPGKDFLVCPNCNNKITDLTMLRCPRCFASLIKLGCDGNCTACGSKEQRPPR